MRKVFTEQKLKELRKLKRKGLSNVKLAKIFECDRSSIVYQLQKLGLAKGITFAKNRRRGHIELSTAIRLRTPRKVAKI